MQKQLEEIEKELSQRIYKEFLVKFNGNKSQFARASNCTEGTVRRIFKNEQGITVNLLLRFCFALEISIIDLLRGLDIRNHND
ncbi:helix-turn-helix domain-containing protein [Flavobacterium sp.]|uniref:helix-turn-helix domain-containing protein n=1 Tax=Flavobacterium sp. TaxID=239 RepID=UPI004034769E